VEGLLEGLAGGTIALAGVAIAHMLERRRARDRRAQEDADRWLDRASGALAPVLVLVADAAFDVSFETRSDPEIWVESLTARWEAMRVSVAEVSVGHPSRTVRRLTTKLLEEVTGLLIGLALGAEQAQLKQFLGMRTEYLERDVKQVQQLCDQIGAELRGRDT
jgi:hypothetical protein